MEIQGSPRALLLFRHFTATSQALNDIWYLTTLMIRTWWSSRCRGIPELGYGSCIAVATVDWITIIIDLHPCCDEPMRAIAWNIGWMQIRIKNPCWQSWSCSLTSHEEKLCIWLDPWRILDSKRAVECWWSTIGSIWTIRSRQTVIGLVPDFALLDTTHQKPWAAVLYILTKVLNSCIKFRWKSIPPNRLHDALRTYGTVCSFERTHWLHCALRQQNTDTNEKPRRTWWPQ